MGRGFVRRVLGSISVAIITACGQEQGVQPAAEIIREVSSGIRAQHRVQVAVKTSTEEPTAEDLETRRLLADRIEQENIGRLVSSASGSGEFSLVVEVENTADAIPRIQKILRSMELAPAASFKVISESGGSP